MFITFSGDVHQYEEMLKLKCPANRAEHFITE